MMVSCKAALTNGDGHFFIDDIEVDEPEADEVRVKMMAAGLCHTDYDSLRWGRSIVLGHEGAGIVESIGPEVSELAVGDRVILNWAIPCGKCFQCREGNEHICEENSPVTAGNQVNKGHARPGATRCKGMPVARSFHLGTLSGYTLVRQAALVKNSSSKISFPAASIIGCGVMTGYGSVVNAAKVKKGSSVVVLGCGGVGLNVIQGARIAGAARIIAVDVQEQRLQWSRKFGATDIYHADRSDHGLLHAAEEIRKMLDGRGADYAFECTAIPQLGAAPLAMVRNAGMAIQVSGIEQEINIDMNLFEWDKIYINPLYGKCRPQTDFPRIIELYDRGELMLEEMITRTYPLNDLDKAFDDLLRGKNAKGAIVFDHA